MTPELQSILDALYALDPQLKEKEAELLKVLEHLQKAKPDFQVDPQFAKDLKKELMQQIGQKPAPMKVILAEESRVSLWLQRIFYPLGGAVVTVGLVFAIISSEDQLLELTPQDIDGVEIITLSKNAFGSLSHSELAQPGVMRAEPATLDSMVELATAEMAEEEIVETSIPAPDPTAMTTYHYSYKGEPVSLEESVQVYRRNTTTTSTPAFNNFLETLGFGLMDLTSLDALEMESIRLKQDKNDYIIELNFDQSEINLYSTDDHWLVQGEVEPSRLPDESSVVSIANTFLNLYGIDGSQYGTPVIEHYERGNPDFFSPYATVIYPIILEGKTAYQPYGAPVGLTVEIDAARRKLVSIQGLRLEAFERSSYDGVVDWSDIEAYLERAGGALVQYRFEEGAENQAVELELGHPTSVLMQLYNDEDFNAPLLTPALRFPILSEDDFVPEYLFVPVAKSLFDQQLEYQFEPPILSEPLPVSDPLPYQPAILNATPHQAPEEVPILTSEDENIAAISAPTPTENADAADTTVADEDEGVMMVDPTGM